MAVLKVNEKNTLVSTSGIQREHHWMYMLNMNKPSQFNMQIYCFVLI